MPDSDLSWLDQARQKPGPSPLEDIRDQNIATTVQQAQRQIIRQP